MRKICSQISLNTPSSVFDIHSVHYSKKKGMKLKKSHTLNRKLNDDYFNEEDEPSFSVLAEAVLESFTSTSLGANTV